MLGIPTVLKPDERGVRYEVPLFDIAYNRELAPGLKAGAYGSSFRFNVLAEEYNRSIPLPARTRAVPCSRSSWL